MYNAQNTRLIINDLAKSQKKSLAKVAEDLGYSNSFFADMKRKNAMPSAEKLGEIADYLNVSVDYLLGRTENHAKKSTGAILEGLPLSEQDKIIVESLSEEQRHDLIANALKLISEHKS
jgi:transcriptional regulator with XRE-family HTH domain